MRRTAALAASLLAALLAVTGCSTAGDGDAQHPTPPEPSPADPVESEPVSPSNEAAAPALEDVAGLWCATEEPDFCVEFQVAEGEAGRSEPVASAFDVSEDAECWSFAYGDDQVANDFVYCPAGAEYAHAEGIDAERVDVERVFGGQTSVVVFLRQE